MRKGAGDRVDQGTAIAGREDVVDVLSNRRRRYALAQLQSVETPVGVSELANRVARWEARKPDLDGVPGDVGEIEVALVHTHLPKLAEAGLAEYDPARRRVAPADDAPRVRSGVDAVADD